MSLVQRIVGGFVILLVALLILVSVSYFSVNQIQGDIEQVTHETLPVSKNASEIKINFLNQSRYVMSIFSTTSPKVVDQLEASFNDFDQRIDHTIEQLPAKLIAANPVLSAELTQVKKVREQYRHEARELIGLYRNALDIGNSINVQLNTMSNLERRLDHYLGKYADDPDTDFRLTISGLDREVTQVVNTFNAFLVKGDLKALQQGLNGMAIVIANRFDEIKSKSKDRGKLFSLMLEPLLFQLKDNQGLYQLYLAQDKNQQQIAQLLEQTQRNIDVLLGSVNTLVEQSDAMVMKAQKNTDDNIGLIKQTMFLISAVSLVIGIVVPFWIAIGIRRSITNFRGSLMKMTDGDFRVKFEAEVKNEFGELGGYLNGLAENLRSTFMSFSSSVQALAKVADTNAQISKSTTDAVNQQRHLLETTASAMTEMESSVAEVAQRAHDTMMAAEVTNSEMGTVGDGIRLAIGNIREQASEINKMATTATELNEYGQKIDSIIETIQNIAEQTNLLALNAAIEAARAGEQGRGFAVVADEVRSLASRTKNSTGEIQSMIEIMQKLIQAVVDVIEVNVEKTSSNIEVAEQAGEGLEKIAALVKQIVDMNMQIAAATEQQSATAREISASVVNISDSAEQTATGAKTSADASLSLREQSHYQQELIEKFKV
ncbi:methyl-accepting chemotaxis protein [Gallaecimonas mangrovi]|uniref:methyl-accepting chemotaxis protein n=1 Tax=Gallaecimonas mangrovi TaxID=2291597 RepID=UPI000E208FBB|nr:methyl-accepting chemotaxis protein [Gallaecimonas mangrovi]